MTCARVCMPVLVLLLALPGCQRLNEADRSPGANAVASLLRIMNERLGLMHDVAKSKWNAKKPIEDLAREQELLDAISEQAAMKGLDRGEMREFFTAQIEAAKVMQRADFARWTAEKAGPFTNARDLASIRRELDSLNEQLLQAYARVRPYLGRTRMTDAMMQQTLQGEGVSGEVRAVATRPLRRN